MFAVLGEWQTEEGSSVEFVLRRDTMLKFGRQLFVCARRSSQKKGEIVPKVRDLRTRVREQPYKQNCNCHEL